MEALEKAGYPREQMFNHCSDLYVFITPLTKRVVDKWFNDEGLNKSLFVNTFRDQITGNGMYDIAFQYTPYFEEKARKSK
jgi:hypothetical protein